MLTDVNLAKRKREEDREKNEKITNGINKYFSAKGAPVAKPKVCTRYKNSTKSLTSA